MPTFVSLTFKRDTLCGEVIPPATQEMPTHGWYSLRVDSSAHSCLSFSPSLCPFLCFSLSLSLFLTFLFPFGRKTSGCQQSMPLPMKEEYSPLHQQGVLPVSENVVYVAEVTAYRCATDVLPPFLRMFLMPILSRCQIFSDAG